MYKLFHMWSLDLGVGKGIDKIGKISKAVVIENLCSLC